MEMWQIKILIAIIGYLLIGLFVSGVLDDHLDTPDPWTVAFWLIGLALVCVTLPFLGAYNFGKFVRKKWDERR